MACLPALLAVVVASSCPDGLWVGSWTMPGGRAQSLAVTLATQAGGACSGTAVTPGVGRTPLQSPTFREGVLQFQWGATAAVFRGSVDDACRDMAGTVRADGTGVFHLQRRPSVHDDPEAMIWTDFVGPEGAEQPGRTVYLLRRGDQWWAEIDAPHPKSPLRAYPALVRTDALSEGVLLIEYPSGDGLASVVLEPGPGDLSALWTRGQQQDLVAMQRKRSTTVACAEPGFPTLTAQVKYPSTSPPHAVAVLIGEDWSGAAFNTAKRLREAGMATLLPDPAENARAGRRDLRRWVQWLAGRADVDRAGIVLIGHGPGASLVARQAAAFGDPVAAIVLLSPPGLPGRIRMQDRIRAAIADPAEAVEAWNTYVKFASQRVHDEALRQAAEAWVRARPFPSDVSEEEAIARAVARSRDADWLEDMGYDPRVGLSRIRGIPVLALTGDGNEAFDGPANLAALSGTAAQRSIAFDARVLPDLDHSLRPSGEASVDPAVGELIIEWLKGQSILKAAAEEGP